MAKNKGSKLEDWEVALIRAMWESKKFTKQEIHPYFTHPDRPINQARISQIADGTIHALIPAASERQLQEFLKQPGDMQLAKKRFLQEDPWHVDNIKLLLRLKAGIPVALALGETDSIECKLAFSWGNRGEYARTIAGFANNRGGYMLFGVKDNTKEVVGIKKGRLDEVDNAEISKFLNQKLSPSIRWDKRELECSGKVVGAMFVWPAIDKPVICTQDQQSDLKEGDVYFRYVGQTTRIRYAELARVLAERDRHLEQRWMDVFSKVAKAGAHNVAVLNTNTGELAGANASYLIDEKLIPSLQFLKEGEFAEKKGAPALKLVGTAQAVAFPQAAASLVEKAGITDWDILDTFLGQKKLVNPAVYIQQLCHIEAKWLPIFYFAKEAALSLSDIVSLLKNEPTHAPVRRDHQVARVKAGKGPAIPSLAKNKALRDLLIRKEPIDVSTPKKAIAFLLATRTLKAPDIDLQYLLLLVKKCFEQHYGNGKDVTGQVRYAAAHIDAECFRIK